MSVWRDERLSSVHEILTTAGIPWAVAGGWALDLFLGRQTREHADLDLAVWRADQAKLRAALASDWRCEVSDNGALRPWHAGERLSLPIHEIHARAVSGAHPPLELLLNERDDTAWIYRRNPAIRRDLDRAILVCDGIPFLAPEIVLLYKSKAPRPTDEADFRVALPALTTEQRDSLRLAIAEMRPDPV
ncbi:MAG TPA: hypothetical protein VL308_10675 [Gemmatimonadaceae bacterium]|nr:hypothetical protein [Gemmatimonadaceae bacterium]